MLIDIRRVCGEDTISREAGKRIRNLILDNWSTKSVAIDFKNKLIGSVSFFDEALALLIKKGNKKLDEIIKKIRLVNLRKEDKDLVNYVFASRVKEAENAQNKKAMAKAGNF